MVPLGQYRDTKGRVWLHAIPLLLLVQRQFRIAFDAFTEHLGYAAWLNARTAVEAVLVLGKWCDSDENPQIWLKRRESPKQYRQVFTGDTLASSPLPRAAELQKVLSTLGDRFIHPNPDYYYRHAGLQPIDDAYSGISVDYFDEAPLVEAHSLAFLHLVAVSQESVSGLFTTSSAEGSTFRSHVLPWKESSPIGSRSSPQGIHP